MSVRIHAIARIGVLGALALGTVTGCGHDSGSSASSCVGPYLDDQPAPGRYGAPTPAVRAGETLTVHGHWYAATCEDTGGEAPARPLPSVRLVVTWPDGQTLPLGSFTPHGRDLGFAADIRVPGSTRPGAATVSDGENEPFRFTITGD